MSRKQWKVRFIRKHRHVTPATELFVDAQKIADIPEKVDEYSEGQVVELSSKAHRKGFIAAMLGACEAIDQ